MDERSLYGLVSFRLFYLTINIQGDYIHKGVVDLGIQGKLSTRIITYEKFRLFLFFPQNTNLNYKTIQLYHVW